jgi:hypothetical protein
MDFRVGIPSEVRRETVVDIDVELNVRGVEEGERKNTVVNAAGWISAVCGF